MSGSSDGPMELGEDEVNRLRTNSVSGKRKLEQTEILDLTTLAQEQINEIIGTVKKPHADKAPQTNTDKNNVDDFTLVSYQKKKYHPQQKHLSPKMNELLNKSYLNLFYFNTLHETTRIQMADIWEKVRPGNKDIILKTKKGYLLKTNTSKLIIINTFKTLQNHNIITTCTETKPYEQRNNLQPKLPIETYSCVISSVETDILDDKISEHLTNSNIKFRYCRRIVSRITNKPTQFIRIISGDSLSYEKLINEGIFYKSRHYAIYPSRPPPPAPLPCNKCLEFTHKTENCEYSVKCHKCQGKHATSKCLSSLPPKCVSCGSEQHQAWSFQCPKRPTKAIEGIPNLPTKTINKKSRQISDATKQKSRIHTPITIHDMIVNTYVEKLNKPKNTNREELIAKLKKKFIQEYNVETTVSFVGNNWIYILMFDLENENSQSPTETMPQNNAEDVRIQN